MKHPMDPPQTHAAVPRFAPLIASGLLTVAEVVPTLMQHAVEHGYTGDRGGLQTRLSWALADQAEAITAARTRAERDIRKAAWQAMDALKPVDVIMRAAWECAGPLTSVEVRAILNDVAAAWLRQRRYRHG